MCKKNENIFKRYISNFVEFPYGYKQNTSRIIVDYIYKPFSP